MIWDTPLVSNQQRFSDFLFKTPDQRLCKRPQQFVGSDLAGHARLSALGPEDSQIYDRHGEKILEDRSVPLIPAAQTTH